MNISEAKRNAEKHGIAVTGDHFNRGGVYFCVSDTTNDESVIVKHISGWWWDAGPTVCMMRRGDAIRHATNELLSKRNK